VLGRDGLLFFGFKGITFVQIIQNRKVLAMRSFLVTCLIALSVGMVSAQTSPRTSTGSTRTNITPSSSSQRSNTASSQTNNRSNKPSDSKSKATTPRTDANSNAAARALQPTAQGRNAESQNANAAPRNTLSRPSLTNQNSGTTARSINNSPKKAAETKVVNPVKVKWMTLEEALEKSKTEKRKIFVDVFTERCGWCKRMDSTTFVNPAVAQYLNENYYPVKFDAEQQKEVVFKEKTYQFKKTGARGYHELAAEWLNNRLTYPTVVFLDESQGTIQPLPGYQDATKMEAILNYFGTDSHKKTPWESYEKKFNQQQKE
jgi:thioredoxin-related protein